MVDFLTNYGIIITYILLAVATLAAVGFPLMNLVKNPKNAKGALLGVGALVLVFGLSYAISSDVNPSDIEISPVGAKLVDAGLYAVYLLSIVAIGSLIYTEVSKLFK